MIQTLLLCVYDKEWHSIASEKADVALDEAIVSHERGRGRAKEIAGLAGEFAVLHYVILNDRPSRNIRLRIH